MCSESYVYLLYSITRIITKKSVFFNDFILSKINFYQSYKTIFRFITNGKCFASYDFARLLWYGIVHI